MKKNLYYRTFWIMYFVFVAGLGFFFPYFNVYLEQNLGFSGSEIGLILSISLLASVIICPLWGLIADTTGKYRLMLRVLLLAYAVFAWLLLNAHTLLAVIFLTTLMEVVGIGMGPMLDVLAVDYCQRFEKDYGKLRIAASSGWVFGSFVAGILITDLLLDIGVAILLPLIASVIIAFVIANFLPDVIIAKPAVDASEKPSLKALLNNRAFVFLMVFNFLTLSLIDSIVAFAGNHLVTTLGASARSIGVMNVVAALPELVLFLFVTRLIKYLGFKQFYLLAVVTLIIRFVIYAFTHSVFWFLAAGIFGPIMMAVAVIGNFAYIKAHVADHLTGRAFTVSVAILTLGRAVFSLIFGLIYDWFGSFMLFKFSIVFFVIALVLLVRTKHFDVLDVSNQLD